MQLGSVGTQPRTSCLRHSEPHEHFDCHDTLAVGRHTFHMQLCYLQLCALYAVTDVALVTSLRDGMNLVSYEYVACQSENAGAVASTLSMSKCQHARPGNFGVAVQVRRPGCTFTCAVSARPTSASA
jgi:Glycosyltransferase family 20